jgi:hypothetical protein
MNFQVLYFPWFRPMDLHVKEIRNSLFMKAYCDMTPESRNTPMLDNGSLKRVSAATDTLVESKRC